ALLEAAIAAIRELSPGNAGDLIDEMEAFRARDWAERQEDRDAAQRIDAILATLARSVPAIRSMLARRQEFLDVMPVLAAKHFLVGIEAPKAHPVKLRQRGGLVDDAVLDEIGEQTVAAIGWKIQSLM